MKVFVFDTIPYDHHFDEFKAERHIPFPLPRKFFDPEIAARTYAGHLEVWREMDRLGYDGVGLNEHHTAVLGLMNSPNMMAAVGAQHTKKLKFLMLGNLLPLHNPLRIAEEIAMADCLSQGRVLAGFARGTQREYGVFGIPMSESRGRFEEAFDVIRKAWTEESFSHQGKFWTFNDVAIWPRPYQTPHPPVWVPFTGSKETIQWAGRNNLNAVLSVVTPGLTEDMVGYYARALESHGHQITPEHLCMFTDVWVADSKADAVKEFGPYVLYFRQTLWHHGTLGFKNAPSREGFVSSTSYDYIRPENRAAAALDREKIRQTTMADIEASVASGAYNWGSAKEVTERLIETAEHAGANALLVNMDLGAVPHDVYLEQIRRFGREVLPRLQAHHVTRVPMAA
jgi:alkanesulfonate monooxygenase SsuD/methylene tetrahydromethanopterin reductase-like flavin-dependent oxidoreductase (luciferase family)